MANVDPTAQSGGASPPSAPPLDLGALVPAILRGLRKDVLLLFLFAIALLLVFVALQVPEGPVVLVMWLVASLAVLGVVARVVLEVRRMLRGGVRMDITGAEHVRDAQRITGNRTAVPDVRMRIKTRGRRGRRTTVTGSQHINLGPDSESEPGVGGAGK
ncbi:hypothetical protein [Streptomyces hawaiiensis]|uniref:Uncharacterized protein n=1 Tax=Streptomyces hawaiiensis TaxID=67305 RepID=A0A6G5R9D6_9ACTN|nr:hypothetical protein [Streptomyces hawaiiensis]QCD54247.1 hypothetical protein CEB94_04815 [Streptomyces hawaiiensis]